MTKPTIIKRIPDKVPESEIPPFPSNGIRTSEAFNNYIRHHLALQKNKTIDDLEPLEIDVEKLASFMYQDDGYYTEKEWIDLDQATKNQWLRLAQSIKTAIEDGSILKEVTNDK